MERWWNHCYRLPIVEPLPLAPVKDVVATGRRRRCEELAAGGQGTKRRLVEAPAVMETELARMRRDLHALGADVRAVATASGLEECVSCGALARLDGAQCPRCAALQREFR